MEAMSSSLCPLRVGVLGGGQLGRMLAEAAHRLGLSLSILDPLGPKAPAGQVANEAMKGSFMDADAVRSFANQCDILTVEIEHVDVETLEDLEKRGDVIVRPSPACLGIIRDKLKQKMEFDASDVPVIEFAQCSSASALVEIAENRFGGFPVMLKARFAAYDGRGNVVVQRADEAAAAFKSLGSNNLYVERWARFRCELAVMVARGVDGSVEAFPVVETRQKNSVCDAVFVPPTMGLSAAIEAEAQRVAVQAVEALRGVGVFGVELFLMEDERVLLNEIAPRPHNSGHYSIEACESDQFEQHLRAITGLPLASSALCVPAAAMLNLFGGKQLHARMRHALTVPGCRLHWYGKDGNRDGRKMAHLTLTANSRSQLQERLQLLDYDMNGGSVDVGIIMGSDSDLPCMKAAADVLRQFGIAFELTVVSAHRTPDRMFSYARAARQRGLRVIIAGAGGAAHLPGMVAALTPLPVIGVPVKSSALSGQDSLLSIVQMPRGVPVATVAIGNACNAALLAVRMLATSDSALFHRLEEFHATQRSEVEGKADRLEEIGDQQYLQEYKKD